MLSSVLKSRALSAAVSQWKLPPALSLTLLNREFCSSTNIEEPDNKANISTSTASNDKQSNKWLLNLEEVKKILDDVHADDVKVIPVPKHYDFADYMVVATGRSEWHVRNIAQALIYRVGLHLIDFRRPFFLIFFMFMHFLGGLLILRSCLIWKLWC